jgi:hypothetical protein
MNGSVKEVRHAGLHGGLARRARFFERVPISKPCLQRPLEIEACRIETSTVAPGVDATRKLQPECNDRNAMTGMQ